MKHLPFFPILLMSLAFCPMALAQGTRADYQRCAELPRLTANTVLNLTLSPHWLPDSSRFYYTRQLPANAHQIILIDAATGQRTVDFVPPKDAQTSPARPSPRPRRGSRRPTAISPDGHYRAFLKDNNLYVQDLQSKAEFALTTDGKSDHFYTGDFHWSPDSTHLVTFQRTPAQEHKVYLVESSPKDQLQPKLITLDYLKPGDHIQQDQPRLFDISSRKAIPISSELFSNPWSISDIRWEADSTHFTFLYNQRGHQALSILRVDASTGQVKPVIDEKSNTFIDYSGKFFCQYLDETHEIIWMSERDGWNHLYLFDSRTGELKNQITRGNWVVRGIDRVDVANRQIYFRASGLDPAQDPYYIHYCRINFDGSNLLRLTHGDGTHTLQYSPDSQFYIDTWSRVDLPPIHELRKSSDGSLICELERADWTPLLKTGWKTPERFVAKGRDGKTDIYGVIFRPTTFDPAKKYPIVEQIYAGPQDSFVPKSFRTHFSHQSMAELGFVVVQVDGMGTSNRSKSFHDVCYKNLKDGGLPDHIAWMKAAAKLYPYMDLTRVGIYGGSAGGQNALAALLFHGDFYKVAVADCGCHDNRMDKIWWNEQWMGWPVDQSYADNSNVTHAGNLTGKLLLIVGEIDHNVDPSSTMQVVNALEKANKDFDLLVMTGTNHGAAETPYGNRRRQDFLVRNLLNVEPRAH